MKKPPLKPLHELTLEDQFVDCFVLLAEKARGVTQTGKPYYHCRFRDAERTVTAMIWGDTPLFEICESECQVGQFYKVRGRYVEHEKYGPQFEISLLRAVQESDQQEGFDPSELVESSRYNADDMMTELLDLARTQIEDEPLRRLTFTLLTENAQALKKLPATIYRFYPFAGGLLEHILSVTKNCIWLVDRYREHYTELVPPLNRDLVIAGAMLHDIGRARELDSEGWSQEQTVTGRLIGHLMLGRDMIREAAHEQGDVDPELLQLLEHIVITHLTLPEWGSPRLPLIPEVILIHHADDLDAKLEMYARCLSRDKASGPFTDKEPSLNRQLFKGRSL